MRSSLGEEVLYRLVIVSLAWRLAARSGPGVVRAAAPWSATDDVGDVRRRWLRSPALFVLGAVLVGRHERTATAAT